MEWKRKKNERRFKESVKEKGWKRSSLDTIVYTQSQANIYQIDQSFFHTLFKLNIIIILLFLYYKVVDKIKSIFLNSKINKFGA